jgi:hypothetical protein
MRILCSPNEDNALALAGRGRLGRTVAADYLVKNQYSGSSMASGLFTTPASLLLVAVTA